MLVINQALLVPGLRHPLLCSNQLRMNDHRINDEPKHLVVNPTEFHHAIVMQTPDDNEQLQQLVIPLQLSGVFSYFEASKPTVEEREGLPEAWCIRLMYDSPEWEPTTLGLDKAESAMVDGDGAVTAERYAGCWNFLVRIIPLVL